MIVKLTEARPTELATLASKINEAHQQCTDAVRQSLDHARVAGALLAEAKTLCQHGEWAGWLAENFSGSDRTARVYMSVAHRWLEIEAKRQNSADLSIDGALKLIAGPKADDSEHGGDDGTGPPQSDEDGFVRKVAKKLGIDPEMIELGSFVLENGCEELVGEVQGGGVNVLDAAIIAKLPKGEQPAAIESHKETSGAETEAVVDDDEQCVDALGNVVPERIVDNFNHADANEAIDQINPLKRLLARMSERNTAAFLDHKKLNLQLLDIKRAVKASMMYAICPACKGRGRCLACNSAGSMPQSIYESDPKVQGAKP